MIQFILHQTDYRLGSWFNLWGCLVRCLQAMGEIRSGRAMTVSEILGSFTVYTEKKWLTPRDQNQDGKIDDNEKKDLFVEEPNPIVAHAWGVTGNAVPPPRQIGSMDPVTRKMTWGEKEGARFSIIKWKTRKYFHFTLAGADEVEIYDPTPGIIKTGKVRVDFYK